MATTDPATSPQALAGIRVIDAATLAAGPMVATTLAEFGAEVIKVEQPDGGDPLRNWGARRDDVGLMWKSVGRNKQSVTLNLRLAAGQELLRRLARISDVLIMNSRPSALERWGLTYDAFQADNPGLVMLHLTGFGAGGPYADRPGFGTLAEAMSGFAHLTGQPDGPPTLPPFPLADGVASLTATYAVMMALYHRDRSGGQGQLIDISLVEPLARLLEHTVLTYDQMGEVLTRSGNRWDVSVPRNTYRTADQRWIAMSGSSPSMIPRIFRAIGRPELVQDPRFVSEQERMIHAEELDDAVATWVSGQTLDDAMRCFEANAVAAAPVYDAADMLADPHLTARNAFLQVPDGDFGAMTIQAPVPRLSATPGAVRHLGRPLGADTQTVLHDLLGVSDVELQELTDMGVTHCPSSTATDPHGGALDDAAREETAWRHPPRMDASPDDTI